MKDFIKYIKEYKANKVKLSKHCDLLRASQALDVMRGRLNSFLFWHSKGDVHQPEIVSVVKWVHGELEGACEPRRIYPSSSELEEISKAAELARRLKAARQRLWPVWSPQKPSIAELSKLVKSFYELGDFEAVAAVYMEIADLVAEDVKPSAASVWHTLEVLQFMQDSMKKG